MSKNFDELVEEQEELAESEKLEKAEGAVGKCKDCGHKFNTFSSTDFTGKLCNDCFVRTGMTYGQGIGT